jgi:hypothetical protein
LTTPVEHRHEFRNVLLRRHVVTGSYSGHHERLGYTEIGRVGHLSFQLIRQAIRVQPLNDRFRRGQIKDSIRVFPEFREFQDERGGRFRFRRDLSRDVIENKFFNARQRHFVDNFTAILNPEFEKHLEPLQLPDAFDNLLGFLRFRK